MIEISDSVRYRGLHDDFSVLGINWIEALGYFFNEMFQDLYFGPDSRYFEKVMLDFSIFDYVQQKRQDVISILQGEILEIGSILWETIDAIEIARYKAKIDCIYKHLSKESLERVIKWINQCLDKKWYEADHPERKGFIFKILYLIIDKVIDRLCEVMNISSRNEIINPNYKIFNIEWKEIEIINDKMLSEWMEKFNKNHWDIFGTDPDYGWISELSRKLIRGQTFESKLREVSNGNFDAIVCNNLDWWWFKKDFWINALRNIMEYRHKFSCNWTLFFIYYDKKTGKKLLEESKWEWNIIVDKKTKKGIFILRINDNSDT